SPDHHKATRTVTSLARTPSARSRRVASTSRRPDAFHAPDNAGHTKALRNTAWALARHHKLPHLQLTPNQIALLDPTGALS
ncbi:hypothetical protein, partial [Streptomyces sp. t39]|uniref:hypothetical protein n=1 Tax=Streptomyces sp. t39 TaxID=1828156 RepID=UPI0016505B24